MYRGISSRRYALLGQFCLQFILAGVLVSCTGAPAQPLVQPTPTLSTLMNAPPPVATPSPLPATATLEIPRADITVTVDTLLGRHPISPFIYGVNGASADILSSLHPTLNRWGGNPSTRYNWQLGNAWNSGSDWQYRNGDYGYTGRSASDDFVQESIDAGAEVLLTVPTLGWVAKNNDTATCSFPDKDGNCGDAGGANCENPGPIADPNMANTRSDVQSVVAWMRHIQTQDVRFIAMDNEPDLWGYTHYDVHPTCTSYDEIRDSYLTYASAVKKVLPHAELLGPVSCCWYYYWNSPSGEADRERHGSQDFLPWFLQQVRAHDEQNGVRTLDVLDIHFYPEGLYNDQSNAQIDAQRLRSTRSLWDATYIDESWIAQPVALIPRMKQIIQQQYPGTKLGISEWNWGGDKTMPGALALAEVLGILGREDVYLANYWRYPEPGTPGFYAFQMFSNYDQRGSRFGDTSVQATSTHPQLLSAYAAIAKENSRLTLLLINKDPQQAATVAVDLQNFANPRAVTLFRYSADVPKNITKEELGMLPSTLEIPPYSLSLLVIEANQ